MPRLRDRGISFFLTPTGLADGFGQEGSSYGRLRWAAGRFTPPRAWLTPFGGGVGCARIGSPAPREDADSALPSRAEERYEAPAFDRKDADGLVTPTRDSLSYASLRGAGVCHDTGSRISWSAEIT
ncbi:hypothetical protein GCM10009550_36470 [Actinocorallia libanotica]|uniref:Uncharacterized protein n=1 Tax=Actinocorallia libanotica TaxID=46162 RepID=A0ABN1R9Q6_9ACTN